MTDPERMNLQPFDPVKLLPCPICDGVEGCDHPLLERLRFRRDHHQHLMSEEERRAVETRILILGRYASADLVGRNANPPPSAQPLHDEEEEGGPLRGPAQGRQGMTHPDPDFLLRMPPGTLESTLGGGKRPGRLVFTTPLPKAATDIVHGIARARKRDELACLRAAPAGARLLHDEEGALVGYVTGIDWDSEPSRSVSFTMGAGAWPGEQPIEEAPPARSTHEPLEGVKILMHARQVPVGEDALRGWSLHSGSTAEGIFRELSEASVSLPYTPLPDRAAGDFDGQGIGWRISAPDSANPDR